MKKYITYFILALFAIFMIFFLNSKVTQNIQNVKTNFDKTEIAILNELASNISTIIKKHIRDESLYLSLKNNITLKTDLEHTLEVIVSKKYKYAYVIQRVKDDRYRFLLDGSIEEKSILGEPFNAINKAWSEVYKLKKPISFKEDDLESIWMTYLYPIIIDDKIEAILAIDFSKKQIEETLGYLKPINNFINYIVVGLFVIVGLLFISVIFWFIKNKESIKRKEELEKNKIYLEKAIKEAQTSSIAKSEFLANMSHEIRTPMNAIIGLTDLVLNTSMSEKQKDYISKIQLSSKSLLTIINDILDFSKIEAGKLELEYRSFLIDDIVNKVKVMFEPQRDLKGLIFNVIVDEKVPKCFISDVVRIEQVLINLLSNSFKFTKYGSIVLLINYNPNDKYNLNIKVKDSGIGIANEKLETLFDSFSQADNSTTREYGGTGLGLSISKQIIELLGGTIVVKSQIDIGTTFEINLNLEVDYESKLSSDISDTQNIKDKILKYNNIEVLIAEDNLINQDVIKGYLDQFDFNIMMTNNGSECLEKIKHNKYDLILMDINMPVMGGYDATKQIREFDKVIPIIALSANARGEDYEYSKKIGMNDHINKPIDPKQLYMILEKNLPKQKQTFENKISKIEESPIYNYNFTFINSEKFLLNFNQNHNLYRTLLSRYYDDYKNCIKDIDNMDIKELENFFHKFKSITGTIGADILFDKVSIYYDGLIDNQNNISLLEDIKLDMKIVNNEIELFVEQFHNSDDINNEVFSDEELVSTVFQELKIALKTKKSKLIKDSFNNLDKLKLNNQNNQLKQQLKTQINLYNYTEALKHL